MISVIVPIYNSGKYLKKCVDSILHQTYTQIEIILVDDGSTDDSYAICKELEKKDNRIVVLQKKNGGLSDARNAGLQVAKGEYITFIDSDDYIHPDMLKVLYNELRKYDADFATCMLVRVGEDDTNIEYTMDDYSIGIYNRDEALLRIHEDVNVTACGKLFKNCLFENTQFEFGRYHEDEFIIHRLIYLCKTIVAVHGEYYYYVAHPCSIMSTLSYKRLCDAADALVSRIYFVKEHHWDAVFEDVVNTFFEYTGSVLEKTEDITHLKGNDIKGMFMAHARNLIKDREICKHMSIDEKLFCISPTMCFCAKRLKGKIAGIRHRIKIIKLLEDRK